MKPETINFIENYGSFIFMALSTLLLIFVMYKVMKDLEPPKGGEAEDENTVQKQPVIKARWMREELLVAAYICKHNLQTYSASPFLDEVCEAMGRTRESLRRKVGHGSFGDSMEYLEQRSEEAQSLAFNNALTKIARQKGTGRYAE